MVHLEEIPVCIEAGNRERVAELIRRALSEGIPPRVIVEGGLVAGMEIVGKKFRDGQAYLPEILIAARAAHAGMDILKPAIARAGMRPKGRIVVGTVEGDMHDIGKKLVKLVLEGEGFEVIDLGVDVSPAKFQEAVAREKADVVGISALLTTTMVNIPLIIKNLERSGWRNRVKVVIGGAPISLDFAREAGADAYGRDCFEAVEIVKEFVRTGT